MRLYKICAKQKYKLPTIATAKISIACKEYNTRRPLRRRLRLSKPKRFGKN